MGGERGEWRGGRVAPPTVTPSCLLLLLLPPLLLLQVRAVVDADWAADVGIVVPPLPVLPAGGLLDSSGVANLASSLTHTLKAVTGEPDAGPSLVDDDNGGAHLCGSPLRLAASESTTSPPRPPQARCGRSSSTGSQPPCV